MSSKLTTQAVINTLEAMQREQADDTNALEVNLLDNEACAIALTLRQLHPDKDVAVYSDTYEMSGKEYTIPVRLAKAITTLYQKYVTGWGVAWTPVPVVIEALKAIQPKKREPAQQAA